MSKARPRVTSRGTYMPKAYQDWRKECTKLLKESWSLPPIETPISVSIQVYGTARGDLDNYMGALFDTANKIVWIDDRANIIQKASIEFFKRSQKDSKWIIEIEDIGPLLVDC